MVAAMNPLAEYIRQAQALSAAADRATDPRRRSELRSEVRQRLRLAEGLDPLTHPQSNRRDDRPR
jgi:hypothetical protein